MIRRTIGRAAFAAAALLIASLAIAPIPATAADTGSIHGALLKPDGTALLAPESYTVALKQAFSSPVRYLATPQEDGSFRIDGIAPGTYWVLFQYSGPGVYLDKYWGDGYFWDATTVPSITITGGEDLEVSEQLDEPSYIKGTITGRDGVVNRPSVTAMAKTSYWVNEIPAVAVEPDGDYAIGPIAPGDYAMLFGSKDTASGSRWTSPGPQDASVLAGETTIVDSVLDRGGHVRMEIGVVETDGTITPLEGTPQVTSWSLPRSQSSVSLFRGAPTRVAPGQFERWVDPRREELELLVPEDRGRYTTAGYWDDTVDGGLTPISASMNGQTDISMTVARGGIIQARVGVDAEGNGEVQFSGIPVFVSLYRHLPDEGLELVHDRFEVSNGLFASPVLEAGTYSLFTETSDVYVGTEFYDDARYFADRTDIEVVANETLELNDIVLEPRYIDIERLSGPDRFAVSVAVSQTLFPEDESSPVVYVANGMNFPDALAAGPAAIRNEGGLLLVAPTSIPASVADELERLRPSRIVVAGGPASVSPAVFEQLQSFVDDPASVVRLGGADRYEAGRNVVDDAFDAGASTAFIATGGNFADALAAGPAAGALNAPVILVNGTSSTVDTDTLRLLDELGVTEIVIAGGPASVSPGIQAQLAKRYGASHVSRAGGKDRFEVASNLSAHIPRGAEVAFAANGLGFADALSVGPLAGAYWGALHLMRPTCVPVSAFDSLLNSTAQALVLAGGPASLGTGVEDLVVC